MADSNYIIKNIVTDAIIVTIILNSLRDNPYYIYVCGAMSIYIITKYV